MTKSEVIRTNYAKIEDELADCYRCVLESGGSVQYSVYIWEDGKIETIEGVQGDHSRLVPYECEPRQLYYVATVALPLYDPWDHSIDGIPDDDAEREAAEKEINDWMIDEYRNTLDDTLDGIIADAEQEEAIE